jgi:hypothetical protein
MMKPIIFILLNIKVILNSVYVKLQTFAVFNPLQQFFYQIKCLAKQHVIASIMSIKRIILIMSIVLGAYGAWYRGSHLA